MAVFEVLALLIHGPLRCNGATELLFDRLFMLQLNLGRRLRLEIMLETMSCVVDTANPSSQCRRGLIVIGA